MKNSTWFSAGMILSLLVGNNIHAKSFNGFDVSDAAIPLDEIYHGGPPRDGIPAIDQPRFISPKKVDFLYDDDDVLSLTIGTETRAYPLRVLAWHEIVNDTIADEPVMATYCPLCGTAMAFSRKVKDRVLDFGVSGLLYQSDMLMYDRQTESLWSQLGMKAVSGSMQGRQLTWIPSRRMSWPAWKKKYPDGKVLSTRTGYSRDYSRHVYQRYEASPKTVFPVPEHRTELSTKEWVIGIIANGMAKAYVLETLKQRGRVEDEVAGIAIAVTYDSESGLVIVRRLDNKQELPVVKLYWFAWQAFYPDTELELISE